MNPSRFLPALLALALLLAACGGDDDASATTDASTGDRLETEPACAATTTPAAASTVGENAGAFAPGEPGTDAEDTATVTAADLGRMIIFTATIEVEVEDIAAGNAGGHGGLA